MALAIICHLGASWDGGLDHHSSMWVATMTGLVPWSAINGSGLDDGEVFERALDP